MICNSKKEPVPAQNTLSGFVGLNEMSAKRLLKLFVQDLQRNGLTIETKYTGYNRRLTTDEISAVINSFLALHKKHCNVL